MLNKNEYIDKLKFTKWKSNTLSVDDINNKKTILNIDEFFEDIAKDTPYDDNIKNECYVINNTNGGKKAEDFYVPSMVFIDIDFHEDDINKKNKLLNDFYEDTNCKSLQEFVDKMSKDKYCVGGGLSKSKFGIRLFFNVITPYFEDYIKNNTNLSVDENKQIHLKNWKYVMRYLSLYYYIDEDAKYAGGIVKNGNKIIYKGDDTANRLHQVTFHYLRTGSFYNKNFESMYNDMVLDYKVIKQYDNNENSEIIIYDNDFLNYIHRKNEETIKVVLSHYDGFHSYRYAFMNQDENTIRWFFNLLLKYYEGSKKLKFDNFYNEIKNTNGTPISLKEFFFKRGIMFDDSQQIIKNNAEKMIKEEEKINEVEDFLGSFNKNDDDNFEFKKTLLLNNKIYDRLPKILQDLTQNFKDESKDALLLSSINVLSYYFSDVVVYYWNNYYHNNLYTYISADSGSGKSIISKSKKLVKKLQNYYIDKYNAECKLYKIASKEKDNDVEEPKQKIILIGGEATRQGILKYLENGDGKLILFEEEADAIGSYKKDFDITSVLRKGYGNETITKVIQSQPIINIDKPKLNVILSGTYDQIHNIVGEKGSSNGTYNRFLIYDWIVDEQKPGNPFEKRDIDTYFDEYNELLFDFYMENFENGGYKELIFTEKQQQMIIDNIKNCYEYFKLREGDMFSGLVNRHNTSIAKMAITFSCLRTFDSFVKNRKSDVFESDEYINSSKLTITDDDLKTIINIINTLLKHSIGISRETSKNVERNFINSWRVEVFNSLPLEFTREQMFKLVSKQGYGIDTVNKWIKKLKDSNFIIKEDKKYKKLKKLK